MLEKVNGKKSFMVALGLILTAVGGVLSGAMTLNEGIILALNGGAVAALRDAISKI